MLKIINPANGQLIQELTEDTNQSVTTKMDLARQHLPSWMEAGIKKRVSIIEKFDSLLEENKDKLARDLSFEVGKPLQEALNEVAGARKRIKFFLSNSEQWLGEKQQHVDGNTTEVLGFDPLGVIANISAWNYPFLVGVNVFIPALIAGNAVLYKPSEFSSITGSNIATLLHKAGVPKDIFALIIGTGKIGEVLLQLPLDGYFFTGSYKTGKYIAEKVAHKLVPVGLELGGKDPLYVTDDVSDLKQVAGAVAEGCFYNNGQSCCAVERVYVHTKVYDQFLKHFVDEVKNLKLGDPLKKETNVGAVTRPVHLGFLEEQLADAKNKGAEILTGGKKVPGTGSFFEPTVLSKVSHSMRIMKEETFGPIIGVMKVDNDQQAVELMNDCDYGLTAAVYSSNQNRAKQILAKIDAGTSYINCCDRVSAYLPWAGRKNSGLGQTLSYLGILAFAKPRGWHIRG